MSIVGNGTSFVTVLTAGNTPINFEGLASVGPENLVGDDGGTDLVFGRIDVLVLNATPLQAISIPFTFDVTITDYPTDVVGVPDGSGVFSVSGLISGTIGAGRKVNMNNIVLNPVAPILIGGDLYTMTLNTIVPPGPFFAGVIGGARRDRARARHVRAARLRCVCSGHPRIATSARTPRQQRILITT